jgi:putative hydrolase of the HAD superfamily
MRPPGTVVFDVGGVIVRWQPNVLMRQCFAQHAVDDASTEHVKTQVFQQFAVGADWAAFDCGAIEADALADRIATRTGLPRAGVVALIDAIPEHIQPMPDSVALLERLRAAGHQLALLSNMPRPYAAHLEASHACFGWFARRVWSGRVGMMKPERGIFDHMQDALSLNLQRTVFLDDHPGNIEAARALGWTALHFETAAQASDGLRGLGYL